MAVLKSEAGMSPCGGIAWGLYGAIGTPLPKSSVLILILKIRLTLEAC